MAFARYLGVLFPGVPPQPAALAVIAALTAVNVRGIRAGRRVQNLLTLAKLAALAALIVLGLAYGARAPAVEGAFQGPFPGWSVLGAATGGGTVRLRRLEQHHLHRR